MWKSQHHTTCSACRLAVRAGAVWQVTGDGIVALARAVPGLRRLALLNCEINDDHLIALASVLTSLHTLQARLLWSI